MTTIQTITPIIIQIPTEFENPNETHQVNLTHYLKSKVLSGAERKFGSISEGIQKRIDTELNIINEKEAAWYFLLVADYVQFALDNNIWIGPGRGSAAGSLVNYFLGITKVDPIANGLIFERFYNYDSFGLPDIDIDVELGGREKIIDYLKQEYGQANVIGVENEKGIPHAATIAISNNLLPGHLKLNDVVGLNCLTVELLSWKYISVLKMATEQIQQTKAHKIDINTIDLEDSITLDLFQRGDTEGILYFEAKSMQDILSNYAPQNFNDLVVLFSLFRPGMVDQITRLIALKKGELLKLVPEEINEIVMDSYGLIVFQEQIMQIVSKIASFNMEQADALRKALGKKQHQIKVQYKVQFFELGAANGHAEDLLSQIWEEIELVGPNVFNKSHSVCYTKLAFQLAFIKAHFPQTFEVANLAI